jgi:uncharacterized protein YjbI with pentapeptide repeats
MIGGIVPSINAESIPEWIKNTAGWWATDAISESEFVNAMEFLIENNIIQVTSTSSTTSSESIPEWIKNTAGWWATDAISESEFVNAMEFLVNVGIISIQSTNNDPLKLLNDLSFLEKTFLPDKKSTHFINSHGFRNIEFSEEKESGVFRIFMIGGSTTYGSGVDDKNTIPYLLQEKIRVQGNEEIQIINAGIKGATSLTEVQLIKEKIIKFDPDLILVYDGFNDIKRYYGENLDPNSKGVSDERLSPILWKDRWIELCQFANKENFDVIVTLQPFLGIGERVYTDYESSLIRSYIFPSIIAKGYTDYESHLDEINNTCDGAYNLTEIFDNHLTPIYYDYVHVGKDGNRIVTEVFYEIIQDYLANHNVNPEKFSSSEINFNQLLIQKIQKATEIIDNADFSNKNLRNHDFLGDRITNSDFSNADLTGANFRFSVIENSNFSNADLTDVSFASTLITNSNFSGSTLDKLYGFNVQFINNNFSEAVFTNSNLIGAYIQCFEKNNSILGKYNTAVGCFSKTSFDNVDFSKSSINAVNLFDSTISNSKFVRSHLLSVNFPPNMSGDFSGTILAGSSLKGNLENAIFSCFEFWCTDFTSKIIGTGESAFAIPGVNFTSSKLSNTDLSNQVFSMLSKEELVRNPQFFQDGVSLVDVDLSESSFSGNNISGSDFSKSNLYSADLSNAKLYYSNLYKTNLINANLSGADLTGANLTDADLTGANLTDADLTGANLTDADLTDAILDCMNHEICN